MVLTDFSTRETSVVLSSVSAVARTVVVDVERRREPVEEMEVAGLGLREGKEREEVEEREEVRSELR